MARRGLQALVLQIFDESCEPSATVFLIGKYAPESTLIRGTFYQGYAILPQVVLELVDQMPVTALGFSGLVGKVLTPIMNQAFYF